jgi:predicted PurR-regulated permease PerM
LTRRRGTDWRKAVVAMRIEWQIGFWAAAFLLLVFLLWLFSGVLLPFTAGVALGYL